MESRPSCVVCLEVPLKVTFKIIREDSLQWMSKCSSRQQQQQPTAEFVATDDDNGRNSTSISNDRTVILSGPLESGPLEWNLLETGLQETDGLETDVWEAGFTDEGTTEFGSLQTSSLETDALGMGPLETADNNSLSIDSCDDDEVDKTNTLSTPELAMLQTAQNHGTSTAACQARGMSAVTYREDVPTDSDDLFRSDPLCSKPDVCQTDSCGISTESAQMSEMMQFRNTCCAKERVVSATSAVGAVPDVVPVIKLVAADDCSEHNEEQELSETFLGGSKSNGICKDVPPGATFSSKETTNIQDSEKPTSSSALALLLSRNLEHTDTQETSIKTVDGDPCGRGTFGQPLPTSLRTSPVNDASSNSTGGIIMTKADAERTAESRPGGYPLASSSNHSFGDAPPSDTNAWTQRRQNNARTVSTGSSRRDENELHQPSCNARNNNDQNSQARSSIYSDSDSAHRPGSGGLFSDRNPEIIRLPDLTEAKDCNELRSVNGKQRHCSSTASGVGNVFSDQQQRGNDYYSPNGFNRLQETVAEEEKESVAESQSDWAESVSITFNDELQHVSSDYSASKIGEKEEKCTEENENNQNILHPSREADGLCHLETTFSRQSRPDVNISEWTLDAVKMSDARDELGFRSYASCFHSQTKPKINKRPSLDERDLLSANFRVPAINRNFHSEHLNCDSRFKDKNDVTFAADISSVIRINLISHRGQDKSEPGDHRTSEIRDLSSKNSGAGPRTGILKHSRSSSSTGSQRALFLLPPTSDKTNKTENSSSACISVPSKTDLSAVSFQELSRLIKHRWDGATKTDDALEAMDRIRAMTTHLCLPVNANGNTDELGDEFATPAPGNFKELCLFKVASKEEDLIKMTLAQNCEDMDEVIHCIQQDLVQVRKTDEVLANHLLSLYDDMKLYKYLCNCHLYHDMMESAIDNEVKKDELSRQHVDTLPERLCSTLKQWGLTRINLQRRRYSIF